MKKKFKLKKNVKICFIVIICLLIISSVSYIVYDKTYNELTKSQETK